MRRREFVTVLAGAAAYPLAARAQQKAMPVIGFLHSGAPGPAATNLAAFRRSLSENGYSVGQDVAIEYRWAEGRFEALPNMAAELVSQKVDLIVAGGGTPPVRAAKGATSSIPIVFANLGDPVGAGIVSTLGRPGGNLTGISILFPELIDKRTEIITELAPRAKTIGLLINPKNPSNEITIGNPQRGARAKGVQLSILSASSEGEIDSAFAALLGPPVVDALIVGADPLFTTKLEQVVGLASNRAIPVMYSWREFVAAGGLISYAPSLTDTYRQAGIYVAKILKGAKAADLPVEQPTKFELVINLKTAKALGLEVPSLLLARADELIE